MDNNRGSVETTGREQISQMRGHRDLPKLSKHNGTGPSPEWPTSNGGTTTPLGSAWMPSGTHHRPHDARSPLRK